MNAPACREVALIAAVLEEQLGFSHAALNLGDALEGVLRERAQKHGCAGLLGYYQRLCEHEFAREELRALAPRLTVGETFFFRESRQIDALLAVALPERLASRPQHEPVRVLSAGCASGEEPYSLAIALHHAAWGRPQHRVKIHGIDVNPKVLQKAERARYSRWALRAVGDELRARCFVQVGDEFELRSDLRRLVTFEERNLMTDDPAFWAPGSLDVIFCRNVMIYLAPQKAREMLARFAHALAPGGFLFLGSSEPLRGATTAFLVEHTHATFYYRRSDGQLGSDRATTRAVVVDSPPAGLPPSAASPEPKPWYEIIQETSERLAQVSPQPTLVAADPPPVVDALRAGPDAPQTEAIVAKILDLLGGERFDQALTTLRALPESAQGDARVALLSAVVHCQRGDLVEAELACNRALEAGDYGGAHYVLGLCSERAGRLRAASQQYKAAAWVDPTFAMPHLRLGLLAKRAGDLATAYHEYGYAAALLESEQRERVVLFGGGFSRWALIGLCQSELAPLRGRS
jgi:chemotaxis protein methyltransferase CheR